ncbi:FAD synthetase 2 [Cardamine amara subsp. amara]|uniref:FAD synthase n=1 Tax=Cardamine amara subsp. amara TaxID=228776 RepID=A0ABD0Z980_CARAN
MFCGGSRVLQHLSDHHHTSIGLGLGFCGAKIVQLSSFFLRPSQAMANGHFSHKLHQRMISSSGSHCRTPGEFPILHNCFSQREDDPELPAEGLSPVSGGIVALGKFDALHIGHRELTIQASRIGTPYLLSFVGMAEVFGWEPRAPIVAKCDRKRVLTSWASYCGNIAPVEYEIEFSSVRQLTPRQFVEKLSKELKVCGVVAGENYRFGYKASGDASELVRLCEEYGITAYIIKSVMDKNQDSGKRDPGDSKDRGQVSSTRVRQALAAGDMRYVSELLGRAHRLILQVRSQDMPSERRISVPRSSILNLPPGNGIYEACLLLVGDESSIPCTVVVDTSYIHVETEEIRLCNLDWSQEFRLLSVEFG